MQSVKFCLVKQFTSPSILYTHCAHPHPDISAIAPFNICSAVRFGEYTLLIGSVQNTSFAYHLIIGAKIKRNDIMTKLENTTFHLP